MNIVNASEMLTEAGVEGVLIQDSCTMAYLQGIADYINEHFTIIRKTEEFDQEKAINENWNG